MADVGRFHKELPPHAAAREAKVFIALALAVEHKHVISGARFLRPHLHQRLHVALAAEFRVHGNHAQKARFERFAAHREVLGQHRHFRAQFSALVHRHLGDGRGIESWVIHLRQKRLRVESKGIVGKFDVSFPLFRFCCSVCNHCHVLLNENTG